MDNTTNRDGTLRVDNQRQEQDSKCVSSYHENDVMCGRGNKSHSGNKTYRNLIEAKKQQYHMAKTRNERFELMMSIISKVRGQNPPGRFLDMDPKTGLWHDIGNKRAIHKTRQALGDAGIKSEGNLKAIDAQKVTEDVKPICTVCNRGARTLTDRCSWYCEDNQSVVALSPRRIDCERWTGVRQEPSFDRQGPQCFCKDDSGAKPTSEFLERSTGGQSYQSWTPFQNPGETEYSVKSKRKKRYNMTHSERAKMCMDQTVNKATSHGLTRTYDIMTNDKYHQSHQGDLSMSLGVSSGVGPEAGIKHENCRSDSIGTSSFLQDQGGNFAEEKARNDEECIRSARARNLFSPVTNVDLRYSENAPFGEGELNINGRGCVLDSEAENMTRTSSDDPICESTLSPGTIQDESNSPVVIGSKWDEPFTVCGAKPTVKSMECHEKCFVSSSKPDTKFDPNQKRQTNRTSWGEMTTVEGVKPNGYLSGSGDLRVSKYDSAASAHMTNNFDNALRLIHAGKSAYVHRLHDQGNVFGTSSGFIAIKSIGNFVGAVDSGKIMRLYDEYVLSRHLSSQCCSAIRRALMFRSKGGSHALYLEWAPGVTVSEWIARSLSRKKHEQLSRCELTVSLAWSIARALSDIHERGAVHNNISVDNIIVDETDGILSVKIIDLGSACLLEEDSHDSTSAGGKKVVNKKQSDLFALGVVFYELFSGRKLSVVDLKCGIGCTGEEFYRRGKRAHFRKNSNISALNEILPERLPFGVNVPNAISTLVANLIEGNEDHFNSAREVEQDLHMILKNADRFLVTRAIDHSAGCLEIPRKKLYGRNDQITILEEAYRRVVQPGAPLEVALVFGPSGAGKSALIEHVMGSMKTDGYFLSGKFHQHEQNEPLSAFIAAFTDYCETVVKGDADYLHQIRAAIDEKVGSYSSVLTNIIPAVHHLIGNSVGKAEKVGRIEAWNRFQFIFRMFVQAITAASHPIVLFLDDLQWADSVSLHLIQSLVADPESKHFLFIGAYCDNDITASHPLADHLKEIEAKDIRTTKINVENLGIDDVRYLVACTLSVLNRAAGSLADLVYRKTSGNAFFIVQCLQSFYDEGLLCYCLESRSWKWDTEVIESKLINDVSVLLTKAFDNLSGDVRNTLQLAACLGSHCEESTLRLITGYDFEKMKLKGHEFCALAYEFDSFCGELDYIVRSGLMQKVGARYQFIHDQIQSVVYALIPEGKRQMLHLFIGSNILKTSSDSELEDALFVVVEHLNKGSGLIHEQTEKNDLATLNLRAGQKAIRASAFSSAAHFFKMGITMLGMAHWEERYDLSLALHELYVEAEYCNGNYESMAESLKHIFGHARSPGDKRNSYLTLVLSLGAQNKLLDAIETGLQVLEQLGEEFPILHEAESFSISSEMSRTREMLEACNFDELVKLRAMKDENKTCAMKFLYEISLFAYFGNYFIHLPLLVFRMVKLSLEHGLCRESAFAFATYGLLLCRSFHDVNAGYRYGEIALNLLQRFEQKHCLALVFSVVYGYINPWRDHIRLSMDQSLYAVAVGMRTGEIQYSMINAHSYVMASFECAHQLALLEEQSRKFCRRMKEYKQDALLTSTLPFWQTILNLMGQTKYPMVLMGEAMDHDKLLHRAQQENNSSATFFIYWLSMFLAYLYGEYELASEISAKCRHLHANVPSIEFCNYVFFDGLVSLALARETKSKKWNILAHLAIKQMRKWALHAPSNFQHKLLLLEAEAAFLSGQQSEAERKYDLAIGTAGEHGFVRDQALAYERSGIFHLSRGDETKASRYYDLAHNLYLRWGAQAKADHIRCLPLPCYS